MAKVLGIEIKRFVDEGFPADSYYECDGGIDLENIENNVRYDLSDFGYIIFNDDAKECTFALAFRKWNRKQSCSYILVEVQKGKEDEFKSTVKALGFKVI